MPLDGGPKISAEAVSWGRPNFRLRSLVGRFQNFGLAVSWGGGEYYPHLCCPTSGFAVSEIPCPENPKVSAVVVSWVYPRHTTVAQEGTLATQMSGL